MYNMRNVSEKSERHRLIINIVNARKITSQSQLVSVLDKNGFAVTQASVSRDLDELGISKVSGVYRQDPGLKPTNYGFLSFKPSGDNLVVARCASGLASALAVRLDSLDIDGIVGTLAGDDTVFIAVTERKTQQLLLPKLRKVFDVN